MKKLLYLCRCARNERFLGIERHLIGADCGIAGRRSRVSAFLDDGARLLMLADDIRLVVAVGHDEGDVLVKGHVVQRLEAQGGLLYPAVVVIRRNGLAGGHADKRYRRHVGEDAHWDSSEVFVHDFSLQPFGWDIADGLDSWE